MQRFFFDGETVTDGKFSVSGDKFNHISRVLRMNTGERAVFCDGEFTDYECVLERIDSAFAYFRVIDKHINTTEPKIRITVFQCLPKGDKMDDMVKRCVQFGAYRIVPVLSRRCVSRPDSKGCAKKVERLNKIARSSAMQSMRGCIPKVEAVVSFEQAIECMRKYDSSFICYEDEKERRIGNDTVFGSNVAFLVGPEGGLEASEAELAAAAGIPSVSLGKRILRTEDAAAFTIPILLYLTDNL